MFKLVLQSVLVVSVLATSTPSPAFIVSSLQLLENMAARRARLNLNDVTAQLTADLESVDTPVEERLYLKTPERLRLVQERPEQTLVFVEREGKCARGPEGSLKRVNGAPTELLSEVLMPKGSSNGERAGRLMALLKKLGVDTAEVALGIYGEDVRHTAYIIGAKPWEKEKPQLWIDRESSQPVRIVTQREGVIHESRFLGYGSPAGGAWFPESIENYRDGKLVRRSRLNEIRTNEKLPETLFSLP